LNCDRARSGKDDLEEWRTEFDENGLAIALCPSCQRASRSSYWLNGTGFGRWIGRHPRTEVVIAIGLVVVMLILLAIFDPEGGGAAEYTAAQATYRIDHVTDGDTVVLRNGQRVRLVQIDTPEVYFGTECYGPQASAITKRLLPEGTPVLLLAEPATDRVDEYGRLLRYVIRARGGMNVNLRLVAVGAAAPYFYEGRRGRYAPQLEALAERARRMHLGLWGACPRTRYDPYRGVQTQS